MAATKERVAVCLGKGGLPVGSLIYTKQGRRENTAFAYTEQWLGNAARFKVSSDLELISNYQTRKAPTEMDSAFPLALADTAPDAWGRRVILRDHVKRQKKDAKLGELNELDFLLAVDDFSRIGALRLKDDKGNFHRSVEEGRRGTPPLVDLEKIYTSSRAVETGNETEQDLTYLLGKGTSLGGMRPKCTVVDKNGMLALGKFPSISDTRSITRGEVLALHLAQAAGIETANSRIEMVSGVAIAIIERFDRDETGGRIPYMSAASMLQASRQDEHSYTEIVDAIRANSLKPTLDAQQLWKRIVFNHLITNVDDHLQNHGFLHCGQGLWRLAPAFDINPFPDKDRESKTWLSEEAGPVTELTPLLDSSAYFGLNAKDALNALKSIYIAVRSWRTVASSSAVGLTAAELRDFAPAFEHAAMDEARSALGGEP